MRRMLWVVAALAALLLVVVVAAGCKSTPESTGATSTGHAQTGATATPAASTAAVYTCPMHPDVVSDKPGQCPKCGMNLTSKEAAKTSSPPAPAATTKAAAPDSAAAKAPVKQAAQVYTCPMHPEVTSDKPGRCPKCGMNLELKK